MLKNIAIKPQDATMPFEPTTVTPDTLPHLAERLGENDPGEKNAQQLRKDSLKIWGGVPVMDVTVVIGMKDRKGNRQEIVHQIETDADIRITECNHQVKEDVVPVREDGSIIGFEPTGKYRFKLDVLYVKE